MLSSYKEIEHRNWHKIGDRLCQKKVYDQRKCKLLENRLFISSMIIESGIIETERGKKQWRSHYNITNWKINGWHNTSCAQQNTHSHHWHHHHIAFQIEKREKTRSIVFDFLDTRNVFGGNFGKHFCVKRYTSKET